MNSQAHSLQNADKRSSVERVRDALLQADQASEIREFPEGTRTAEDAAAAIGCAVAQIAKSLIFRAEDQPVLVLTSGSNRVNPDKIKAILGKMVTRADADWVREVTGFAIGGVAPIGHLCAVRVILDQDLFQFDTIWAAAGSPRHVFRTTAQALLEMCQAQVADIKV